MAKEQANYNVTAMTFNALGKLRTYTFDKDALMKTSESTRKLTLIGARNVVIDSVATFTKKTGFTDEQRIAKSDETMAALNAGKAVERKASVRGESVSVSKLQTVVDIDALRALAQLIESGILPATAMTSAQRDALAKAAPAPAPKKSAKK